MKDKYKHRISLVVFALQMDMLTYSLEMVSKYEEKEIAATILVIGFIMIGITACRRKYDHIDKRTTPIPQTTLMVDQEDTNRLTTETPEITVETNSADTEKKSIEPKSPTYIPEGLLTLLEGSIIKGHDMNSFSNIVGHKELVVRK